jgi:hypothetical protein
MKKSIPWLLSAILAVGLAVSVYHYQGVIKEKDAQLEAATSKLSAQTAENDAKLREANQTAERATNAVQQIAAEASAKIDALEDTASKQLAAANLPEATVLLSMRKALVSSGNVATIKNTSAQTIGISVVATRPASNQRKGFEMVLDSQQTKEIGEREGWAFISGDVVTVEQSGHKPRSLTVK